MFRFLRTEIPLKSKRIARPTCPHIQALHQHHADRIRDDIEYRLALARRSAEEEQNWHNRMSK